MINKKLVLGVSLFLFGMMSYGQENLLNAKTPDEIGKKTAAEEALDNDNPLPYGYIGKRDILFSKKVWETIDLNQRVNFPLYFPTENSANNGNLGSERKSLFVVLTEAIEAGTIKEIYADSYFITKKSYDDVKGLFFFSQINSEGTDVYNRYQGEKKYKGKSEDEIIADLKTRNLLTEEHFDTMRIKPDDVSAYQIVGVWYFDKRQGELKYRILGICPLAPDALGKLRASQEGKEDDLVPVPLFWVFYPSARDVLHKAKGFNEKNSSMPLSFDHILNSRRFSSTITREENVYGDRDILDYLKDKSQMQLLEAERIKEKIRNFEQDMWNY